MSNVSVKKLHSFLGHNDSIYILLELGDNRFVSSGGDGMVILWNLKSPDEGEVIVKVPGSVYALAYDALKGFLYVGQNNQGVHKIDIKSKKEVKSIQLGEHQIFSMKIINGMIWTGLSNGEIVFLSKDLKIENRIKFSNQQVRNINNFEKNVAVGFSDNMIRIIRSNTVKVIKELQGHKNSVFASKFHPSGKYLISVGRDAYIKIWDTQVDYVLRESIAAHLYSINDVTFKNDGRYFATASMDKTIKLWDAYTFKLLKVLDKDRYEGHKHSVNKLLWMNYQDLLVTCSNDRMISVWEIKFAG